MGSIGNRARRESLRKADSIFRQSVERGRFHALISIAVDVVGAQCIDRYKKNIRLLRFCLHQTLGVQNRN